MTNDNTVVVPPTAPPEKALVPIPFATVVEPIGESKSYKLAYVLLGLVIFGVLGLVGYYGWQNAGTAVTVTFEEKHDLEPGSAVTLNDVQIGTVKDIELLANRRAKVDVRLSASREVVDEVTRDGTTFHIKRFRFNFGEGAKNVGAVFANSIVVKPGGGTRNYHFIGLEEEPPNLWFREGELPLVLRAPSNQGVNQGSKVLYRGLPIGEVAYTQLARDSRSFEVWVRVYSKYRDLVFDNSIFVNTSGVDAKFGVTGFSLSMLSVESMLAGSIEMFIPDNPGSPAKDGHEFRLEDNATDEYRAYSPNISFGEYRSMYNGPSKALPKLSQASLSWKYARRLRSDGHESIEGLALLTDAGILAPETMLKPEHDDAKEVSLSIGGVLFQGEKVGLEWAGNGVAFSKSSRSEQGWPVKLIRHAAEPESATVYGPGGLSRVINREYLTAEGAVWKVTSEGAFQPSWNGAAVTSARDGKLIGLLLVDKKNRAVVHIFAADAPFVTNEK